jgi:hypothetical protein
MSFKCEFIPNIVFINPKENLREAIDSGMHVHVTVCLMESLTRMPKVAYIKEQT